MLILIPPLVWGINPNIRKKDNVVFYLLNTLTFKCQFKDNYVFY